MRTCYLLSLAVLLCIGCGGSGTQPPLGTVSGIVTLDGQPLDQATVIFQPENGRFSRGVTDTSGRYTLDFNAHSKGAMLGRHTVAITTYRDLTDATNLGSAPFKEILPAKYHEKSELTVEVKPGSNEFPFDLLSKTK